MVEKFKHYCLWLSVCPKYYIGRKYGNLDRSLWAMVRGLREGFSFDA